MSTDHNSLVENQNGTSQREEQGYFTFSSSFNPGIAEFPNLMPKVSPTDLAEHINEKVERVGATISVMEKNGTIPFVTNNFYLTSMGINLNERAQIVETMESAHISFFDESVRVYSFGGVALDHATTDQFNVSKYFHQSSLLDLYNTVLRGSKLIGQKRIAILKVYNHLIYGFPLSLRVQYNADANKLAQFSMQWVVLKHHLGYLAAQMMQEDLKINYSVNHYQQKLNPVMQEISAVSTVLDKLLRTSHWDSELAEKVFPGSKTHGHSVKFWQDIPEEVLSEAKRQLQSSTKAFQEQIKQAKQSGLLDNILQSLFPQDYPWDHILNQISTLGKTPAPGSEVNNISFDGYLNSAAILEEKLFNLKAILATTS